MSADTLSILTRVIPEPQLNNGIIDDQPVNLTLSYHNSFSGDIRTLSTSGQSPEDVEGFLYVPDLTQRNAACQNASSTRTAVDTANYGGIPDSYSFVAIAPWFSAECVLAYMAQAKVDGASAFVFYIPDNGITIPPTVNNGVWGLGDGGQWKSENPYPVYAIPGEQGMNVVAALSSYSDRNLSAVPNGDLLSAKYSSVVLVRLFVDIGVDDAPALPSLWNFLLIVLGILLFFVGIVSLAMHWFQRRRRANLRRRIANGEVDLAELGIVKRLTVPQEMLDKLPLQLYNSDEKLTSTPLQPEKNTRVFITDLDPIQDDIEKKSAEISSLPRRNSDTTELRASSTSLSTLPPAYLSTNPNPTATSLDDAANIPLPTSPTAAGVFRFSQPTCAICLDDFVPGQTTIRILPCEHIFHPDCVDDFLLNTSSLCPMCKTSVLPHGYCPTKITNAMVRRERRLQIVRQARLERRRRQEQAYASGQLPAPGERQGMYPVTRTRAWRRDRTNSPIPIPATSIRLFRVPRVAAGRRISSAPTPSTIESRRMQSESYHASIDAESRPATLSPAIISDSLDSDLTTSGSQRRIDNSVQAQSRREWARQRALALMNRRASVTENRDARTVVGTVTEADRDEEHNRRGRIRKVFDTVFPGFR